MIEEPLYENDDQLDDTSYNMTMAHQDQNMLD